MLTTLSHSCVGSLPFLIIILILILILFAIRLQKRKRMMIRIKIMIRSDYYESTSSTSGWPARLLRPQSVTVPIVSVKELGGIGPKPEKL